MNRKGIIGLVFIIVMSLALSACGGSGKKDNTLVIGAQNYTDPLIIANMYKALIEDRTDLKVKIKQDLASSPIVIDALKMDEIQMATLYTGEVFNNYFEVEQTKDRQQVLKLAQEGFDEHYGFKWFDPYGYENTYVFAVREDLAAEHHLNKISDVEDMAGDMTVGVDTTWLERDDIGYRVFQKEYGFSFKEALPMQIGLVYEAAANKKVDIVLAYSVDPGLIEYNLQTLQDDKQFFYPYDASPVVRKDMLEQHPDLEEAVNLLVGKIDAKTMTQLCYEVEVEKQSAQKVAVAFLQEIGLLQ
ncbi:glycine betaine ABC transporter substrate-binding protein [Paenibacillus sp. MSJ-34]|uniref:glycine betaine ABC transporter substrate-binding protein n=1 Tax=Paenibacillus sp. MSJ-34 TaxID=2841529 RepID=UPI001C11DCB8|nr:glycine betaine ABC transporter substrate-binding protein [Paenibacillus sp. MSJ-34]MBU5443751.1 osmoprotectant ABC transporter substrate-binding protein [Paenibacillus sp. MSJ-34]